MTIKYYVVLYDITKLEPLFCPKSNFSDNLLKIPLMKCDQKSNFLSAGIGYIHVPSPNSGHFIHNYALKLNAEV